MGRSARRPCGFGLHASGSQTGPLLPRADVIKHFCQFFLAKSLPSASGHSILCDRQRLSRLSGADCAGLQHGSASRSRSLGDEVRRVEVDRLAQRAGVSVVVGRTKPLDQFWSGLQDSRTSNRSTTRSAFRQKRRSDLLRDLRSFRSRWRSRGPRQAPAKVAGVGFRLRFDTHLTAGKHSARRLR